MLGVLGIILLDLLKNVSKINGSKLNSGDVIMSALDMVINDITLNDFDTRKLIESNLSIVNTDRRFTIRIDVDSMNRKIKHLQESIFSGFVIDLTDSNVLAMCLNYYYGEIITKQ